jgi:drug/metabolite transporter (DMT)-like permease
VTSSASRLWPAALAAIAGSAMVGTMPLVARRLYAAGLSPSSLLFWRYGLALVALAIVAAAVGLDLRRVWRQGAWRIALVGATLGAAQTLCYWESIKTLPTSIAVLLFYTYPALTLLLDRLCFKAAIRPLAVACIVVIFAGAALITGPGLERGGLDPKGLMWALPGPVIYALYLAITTQMLRRHPPLVSAGALFLGMLLTFGLAAPFVGLDAPESAGGWLLLLFIALGPGALTMTLFSYSAPRLGASSYAILANTELLTVVLIGTTVLGERLTPARAIGGAFILAGIVTRALMRQAPHPGPLPASGEREGPVASATGG